jgi:hypothetical protein
MWGKVVGGMADLDIDWLMLAGQAPNPQMIAARFHGANSLQTLLLLVDPFAVSSNQILYHLLQVVGWTVAGGVVGWLAWRKWVKYQAPWSVLVVTAGGGLIMLATHVGLPYWLPEALSERALASPPDPVAPLFSLLTVIVVGTILYSLRESLDLPVLPKRSLWTAPRQKQRGGFLRPGLLAFLNARPNLNQARAEEEEKRCQRMKTLLIHVALSAYHITANYLNGNLLRTNPD